MPIWTTGWHWFEPRLPSGSSGTKAAFVALGLAAAFCYLFLGPLVFDAGYWVLGRIARTASDRRLRVGLSGALVALYLVVVGISGSATPNPTPGATASPVAAASVATPSTGPTVSISPTEAASPSATADADDEASGSPGTSFAPSATGIVATDGGGTPADRLPGEPDPTLTPGALNPAVTQATIKSTICVSGWTATIRPSSSFTDALKVKQIGQYGYGDTKTADYEEDHLISLELGGAPADARNLWPEPYTASLADGRPTGAHTKDGFETKLKNEVCAGSVTLARAQSEIGDQWVRAFYGIALPTASALPTTSATAAPTPAPTPEPTVAPPAGTPAPVPGTRKGAVCKDGTTSDATGSGACSHHGGVDHWLYW